MGELNDGTKAAGDEVLAVCLAGLLWAEVRQKVQREVPVVRFPQQRHTQQI